MIWTLSFSSTLTEDITVSSLQRISIDQRPSTENNRVIERVTILTLIDP